MQIKTAQEGTIHYEAYWDFLQDNQTYVMVEVIIYTAMACLMVLVGLPPFS